MGKFISHDGTDTAGIRAEISVQTGTGVIKEINGRGTPDEKGNHRNYEVVFTPDNPKLRLKMYGLIDTTNNPLWDYVQKAHQSGQNVEYRIESQRKRNVDRSIPFEDLNHSEQSNRILAMVDSTVSTEALTSPAEDPAETRDARAYPATAADVNKPVAAGTVTTGNPSDILVKLREAFAVNLPETVTGPLQSAALLAGASIKDVLNNPSIDSAPNRRAEAHAQEEKPWVLYNSDGRLNLGSYAVGSAVWAEEAALEHLISMYSPKTTGEKIEVTDEVLTQGASLAHQFLLMADAVQVGAYEGGRANRQRASYRKALGLVVNIVTTRLHAPIGATSETVNDWRDAVITEGIKRLAKITSIADPAAGVAPAAKPAAKPVELVEAPIDALATFNPFVTLTSIPFPHKGDEGFVPAEASNVATIREIFEESFPDPTEMKQASAMAKDLCVSLFGAVSFADVHEETLTEFIDILAAMNLREWFLSPAA